MKETIRTCSKIVSRIFPSQKLRKSEKEDKTILLQQSFVELSGLHENETINTKIAKNP